MAARMRNAERGACAARAGRTGMPARRTKYHEVRGYTAVFEPDAEAGRYTITIPALRGSISEADSFEKALANKGSGGLYVSVSGGGQDVSI